MENISSIKQFDDVAKLIKFAKPEALKDLSSDILCDIEHSNDYDQFCFVLVNDDSVLTCDGYFGQVLGKSTLDEFITCAIDFAEELENLQ